MPYIIDNITANTIDVKTEINLRGESLGPKYKVYTALLTQTGTDAPVANVLENTLGGEIVWSYQGVGQYFGELTNAFPLNKTGCFIGGNSSQSNCPSFIASTLGEFHPLSGSVIYVQCSGVEFTPDYYTNDALSNTMIEIRVYN
jgi:hypothetical protein